MREILGQSFETASDAPGSSNSIDEDVERHEALRGAQRLQPRGGVRFEGAVRSAQNRAELTPGLVRKCLGPVK